MKHFETIYYEIHCCSMQPLIKHTPNKSLYSQNRISSCGEGKPQLVIYTITIHLKNMFPQRHETHRNVMHNRFIYSKFRKQSCQTPFQILSQKDYELTLFSPHHNHNTTKMGTSRYPRNPNYGMQP